MAQPLSSFEVLAVPLVPGVPNVPYVQQGYFLQVSNLGSADTSVAVFFSSSPAFVASSGAVKLFTNIVDQNGNASQYPVDTFLVSPVGFGAIPIPAGATILFGVQYLLEATSSAARKAVVGSTPQDSAEARGFVTVNAMAGSNLLVLPTIRQVFNNYDSNGNLLDIAESAYSVPLAAGAALTF